MPIQPRFGDVLSEIGTAHVEIYAHTSGGRYASFFIKTDEGAVYEMRWDALDYMAAVKKVSCPEPDYRFNYFAAMETIWRVGDTFWLAQRGSNKLEWRRHGAIVAITYDEPSSYGLPFPRNLE
jgi:hypothetical protein